MHVTKLKISYSRSPVNTLRNDPLTCNRKNPRKTTTIYIYRIKCPAYISNNVTTTQKKSVSKKLFVGNLEIPGVMYEFLKTESLTTRNRRNEFIGWRNNFETPDHSIALC